MTHIAMMVLAAFLVQISGVPPALAQGGAPPLDVPPIQETPRLKTAEPATPDELPPIQEAEEIPTPLYKKWWFWGLLLLGGAGAMAMGGGSKGGSTATPAASTPSTTQQTGNVNVRF